MPDIQLRDVIDNLRSRLQAELESELAAVATSHEQAIEDARRLAAAEAEREWNARLQSQLAAVATTHEEAIEEARRAAAAEAERQWAARLDAVRADWTARLQEELTAARSEAERQMVAETMRVRVDAEQAAAEASSALRHELEHALAAERERAADDLRTERDRADRALAEARAALEAERKRTAAALAEASTSSPASIDSARLLSALAAIDEAATLTDVLRATVRAASAEARRATMLIVNGAELDEWVPPGGASLGAGAMRVDGRESGFLGQVVKRGEPIVPGRDVHPPAFAAIPTGRKSVGAPLVLGGETVAVLYADEGPAGDSQPGWIDTVQVIARHAAASLACITAQRTVQALGAPGSPVPPFSTTPSGPDEEEGARRYARLLVSEIKLYNEAAVKAGRQMQDLSHRLRPEIERARRLYNERIGSSVASRDLFFQQELVQTLAGGDPSLLG